MSTQLYQNDLEGTIRIYLSGLYLLTNVTTGTRETRETVAGKTVSEISTRCPILTGVAETLIDIYHKLPGEKSDWERTRFVWIMEDVGISIYGGGVGVVVF